MKELVFNGHELAEMALDREKIVEYNSIGFFYKDKELLKAENFKIVIYNEEENVLCEGCSREIPVSELSDIMTMYICKTCSNESSHHQFENTETIASVEAAANEILKGTELNACVIETSELYEADTSDPEDMKYQDAKMYEAMIEDKEGNTVSETTGRYCDLSSVKDELEAFANQLAEDHLSNSKVENTTESTPVLYIQPDSKQKPTSPETPDSVRYFAVGHVRDGLFTGLVHGYEGGGEYSDHPVLDGKFLPHLGLDGDSIEDGVLEEALLHHTDITFLKRCYKQLGEYIQYSKDGYFWEIKNREHFNNMPFIPFDRPDYSNTEFGNPLESWTNEDYLEKKYDIYTLAREQTKLLFEEDKTRDSKILIKMTKDVLSNDLKCSPFMTEEMLEKVETHLALIFNHAENLKLTLDDYNLIDCEICSNCNVVLLPDDELYEAHNGKYLCGSCSYRCDSCESYFTDKEISTIDGLFLCNTCKGNTGSDATDSRDNIIKEIREKLQQVVGFRGNLISIKERIAHAINREVSELSLSECQEDNIDTNYIATTGMINDVYIDIDIFVLATKVEDILYITEIDII